MYYVIYRKGKELIRVSKLNEINRSGNEVNLQKKKKRKKETENVILDEYKKNEKKMQICKCIHGSVQ